MKKVWIVVANSTHAKIYQAENTHKLIEKKAMEHVESQMQDRDLVSDNQGRNHGSFGGYDTYSPRTSVHTKEAVSFSDQIVEFLENINKNGECERLYIIAKAPFLGHLRGSLSPSLAKLVHQEIGKDLMQLTPEQIREYLPPVL